MVLLRTYRKALGESGVGEVEGRLVEEGGVEKVKVRKWVTLVR